MRDFVDRPELRGPLAVYLQSVLEQQFARAADFLEQAERWLPAWQDAATFSDEVVRLDPTRLEALNEELFAVIERYRAEPVEHGQTVVVQVQSFPRGDAG